MPEAKVHFNAVLLILSKCAKSTRPTLRVPKIWLQHTSYSWLLVLDNADDPELDYAIFIPAAAKGSILITSRVDECINLQTAGKDWYESLHEETAKQLLLKACKIDFNLLNTHAKEVETIVKLLGYHALAIIQAGASISKGICSLRDYKYIFEKHRSCLLTIYPYQKKSEYGNVYATFEVSATYLSNRSDRTAKDAMMLIDCYAFMDFANIPEGIFETAWWNSRKICHDLRRNGRKRISDLSLWHVSCLPKFMRQDLSGDLDQISLRQARALLASLSIIRVDLPTMMTSMHPVTHMWARDRLREQEERTGAWLSTLSILCLSITDPFEQEALWIHLQPHVEIVFDFPPGNNLFSDDLYLHQSFFRLSWVLHELRADKVVISMLQKWFFKGFQSWRNATYSQDILYLYSRCLLDYGNIVEATELLEQVVDTEAKTLK